ncbi:RNA-binding protein pop5 [Savitreella phatthalungensis]
MVRLKHRYILFELRQAPVDVQARLLIDQVRSSLQLNFGTYASGKLMSSMYVKYYSPATQRGILQADRTHYRLAWAAMTLCPGIPHTPDQTSSGRGMSKSSGSFRVLGVSGTMRKAQERLVKVDRNQLFLLEP